MPRTLARLPYGAKQRSPWMSSFSRRTRKGRMTQTIRLVKCRLCHGGEHQPRLQAAWLVCPHWGVESGGMVETLPVHTFPTDDGGVDMKCPTEIAITDRREAELAKSGLIPLSHWKNTDFAVFVGAQSLQKAQEYDDPDATANANLAARLPYLFATCRFAHYLKCIVRDKIGSFKRTKRHGKLAEQMDQPVCNDTSKASEESKIAVSVG